MNRNRIVVIDGGYDSYELEWEIFHRAGLDFEIYSEASDAREPKINFARGVAKNMLALLRGETIDDCLNP